MVKNTLSTSEILGVFIVFCILLALSSFLYFVARFVKTRPFFGIYFSLKTTGRFFDLTLGIALGSIAFLYFYLQNYFLGGSSTVMPAAALLVTGWMLGPFYFWGALFPVIGATAYYWAGDVDSWVNLAFVLFSVFLVITVHFPFIRYGWLKKLPFLLFWATVAHVAAALAVYFAKLPNDANSLYLLTILSSLLFFYLLVSLAVLINRGLLGTQRLAGLVRYDFVSFVKQHFAKDALHEFVSSRKIEYGALISFFPATQKPGASSALLYKAVQERYKDTECLMINLASVAPTVFVPMRGDFSGTLAAERNFRSLASAPVVEIKDLLETQMDVRAFGTIYGVHTASVGELMQINESHLFAPDAIISGRLSVFNQERSLALRREVDELTVFLDSFDARKVIIDNVALTGLSSPVHLARLSSFSHLAFGTDECMARVGLEFLAIAARYFAMRALRDFFVSGTNGKIAVYYPVALFLSPEFDADAFLARLKRLGEPLGRIVFCLNKVGGSFPKKHNLERVRKLLRSPRDSFEFAVHGTERSLPNEAIKYVVIGEQKVRINPKFKGN